MLPLPRPIGRLVAGRVRREHGRSRGGAGPGNQPPDSSVLNADASGLNMEASGMKSDASGTAPDREVLPPAASGVNREASVLDTEASALTVEAYGLAPDGVISGSTKVGCVRWCRGFGPTSPTPLRPPTSRRASQRKCQGILEAGGGARNDAGGLLKSVNQHILLFKRRYP